MHTTQLEAQKAQIKLSEKALQAIQQTGRKIEELSQVTDMIPDSWLNTVNAVRTRFAIIKVELQWFAFCLALSALFWLLGSPRLASISFVLYGECGGCVLQERV